MTEQLAQDSIFNAATYFNNFRNTKVFPSKFQFSSVYSRDILLKNLKDGKYIINLDKYTIVGTHRATYSVGITKYHILIFFLLSIFQKRLKKS